MNSMADNRAMYLAWVQAHFPDLYRDAVRNTRNNLSGLGDETADEILNLSTMPSDLGISAPSVSYSNTDTSSNLFDSLASSISSLASTYVNTSSQLDLVKLNAERAARGQVPLTYVNGQLVAATAGMYPVNPLNSAISSVSPMTWLLVGLGILGLVAVTR